MLLISKVIGDILLALDSGNLAMLSLLDLSAGFDTVDHHSLLQRLRTSYGFCGVVLKWFMSYQTGRTQFVRTSATASLPLPVVHGVPQGSVLGPILFLLYVADLLQLIRRHQLVPHAYADDTQIYCFCTSTSSPTECADAVLSWMRANRLQANPSKTEVLWCSSGRRQHQIPTTSARISIVDVLPVSLVRDLGVHIDSDVAMRSHVTATVRSCFAALRQLRSLRRCLPQQALLTLIRALIISKVDYCCSVLVGISGHISDRLQSVLNAAARLVFSARRSERITPLLHDLHWLRVPERIWFRLCDSICRVADVEGRRHMRSSATVMCL